MIAAATAFGLLGDIYRETPARDHLAATLRGQDVVTLLAVPVLLVSSAMARKGSLRAHVVSLGVLLYVPYTYLMYVVTPYNDAFLLYVAAIGIGGYLLLTGLFRIDRRAVEPALQGMPRRRLAWFLVVTGSVFSAAWLAQNLSVLPGGQPEGLFVYDIPSIVHVLDLAFVLPLVIGTGVLLLRSHPMSPVLAALVLVKMVTLGLALLSMNAAIALTTSGSLDVAEVVAWTAILVTSSGFLAGVLRRLPPAPVSWSRPSIWC